jgi:hypothetical protein
MSLGEAVVAGYGALIAIGWIFTVVIRAWKGSGGRGR